LLGPLPAGPAAAVPPAHGHRALRTPAVARSHAAGRTAREIAVAAVAAELLSLLTAALMARAESAARSSAGLPDGEFRDGTRRRLLPFRPRQRGADERSVDRTAFFRVGSVCRAVGGAHGGGRRGAGA